MIAMSLPGLRNRDYLALSRKWPSHRWIFCDHVAGAYGAVQAGTYNSRFGSEVLVNGSQYALVRPRELTRNDRLTNSGLVKLEIAPAHLALPVIVLPFARRTQMATLKHDLLNIADCFEKIMRQTCVKRPQALPLEAIMSGRLFC